jgi:outer membrane protein TolC
MAEVVTLEQAIERALVADYRIMEREHHVAAAKAMLQEASGSDDLLITANTFVGLAPTLDGGLYGEEGEGCTGSCVPRDDNRDIDGLTLWSNLQFAIIKPLNTFGKISSYEEAAKGNIEVKRGDVAVQKGKTVLDVSKAYFGYLAARDTRKLMIDVRRRLESALTLVEGWLENGTGSATQSDLFALRAGISLIDGFMAKATAVEGVAQEGLVFLLAAQGGEKIELADHRIRPLPKPQGALEEFRQRALDQRPEMGQVEAGLKARKALVEAKQAEGRPNLYAGVIGSFAYTPNRSHLDNPHIYDPFNHEAATAVLGVQWDFSVGAQPARVAKAQAELDAMIALASFARQGIPFEVAENYNQAMGYYDMVNSLEQSSRDARRWMIASYADFEAGIEDAEKVITALQSYVLAYSQYLQTVYEYNMFVMKLAVATGDR